MVTTEQGVPHRPTSPGPIALWQAIAFRGPSDVLAAQRDAEIESGQIDELDGPQALAQLRAKYR